MRPNPGERCRTFTGKWQPVAHAKRKHLAFEEEMRREAEQTVSASDPNSERST